MFSGLLRFHQLSAPFSCRIHRIMNVTFSSVTGQSPSTSTSLAQSTFVPPATSVSEPVVAVYDSCDTAGAAMSPATRMAWASPPSRSDAAVGAVIAAGCGASANVRPSAEYRERGGERSQPAGDTSGRSGRGDAARGPVSSRAPFPRRPLVSFPHAGTRVSNAVGRPIGTGLRA